MDGVHVRAAREGDLEQLAEIHASAYPEPGGYERHARRLTHNAFGGLDCIRVAERDGAIVGQAALFRLELWLGGRAVPTGGIGSLAVAPEARRQQVGSALLEAMHREIASDGGALAFLYPFRQRYYSRLGYATVSPLLTLEVASDAFETLLRADADAFSAVRMYGSRVNEARRLYQQVAARTSGRISRSESRWLTLFAREHWHWVGVAGRRGELEAYASFSLAHRSPGGDQKLVVHELTAGRPGALAAMLAVLGRQRDQVTDIELTLPYGHPLAFAFEDAAGLRANDHGDPLGTMLAGPMVRMVDLHRALSLRGYAADGDLTFGCTDGAAPASVRLVVRDGVGHASPARESPGLELSSATLASIVASGIRPTEAAEVGLLRASSAALAAADAIFSGPRFQCLDPF